MRFMILISGLLMGAMVMGQNTIQWQKALGGSNYDEIAAIHETTDHGILAVGYTASTDGDIFGNHGGQDIWVVKFDLTGNFLWKKCIGGSSSDVPRDMKPSTDGGCIIVGYSASNDFDVSGLHGETDGWVVKLAANGTIQWQKALGGSLRDYFDGVVQLPDGGYFIAGNSKSSDGDVPLNKGTIDLWLVRLGANGDLIWSKTMGGSSEDLGRAVDIDSSGNLLVAGETLSTDGDITNNHGNEDFWIIKLSPSGELIWQQTYGGSGAEVPWEIHPTSDHGYIVIGYTGSVETGQVIGNQSKGYIDAWIIKIDSSGGLEWQRPLGGSDPDYGRSIFESNDGSFIAGCQVQSHNGDISNSHGAQDAWIVKLSAAGELIWEQSFGGSMPDACYSIAKTSDDEIAFGGYTWSEDGDLNGLHVHGKDDYWIVKLSPESVSANEPPNPGNGPLIIYPNPAHDFVRIENLETPAAASARIMDMLGRVWMNKELPGSGSLDISLLPEGVYTLEVVDNREVVKSCKLIKW